MKRNNEMLDMLNEMADEREEAARVEAQQAERSECLQTWCKLPFQEMNLLALHCSVMHAQHNTYNWLLCVLHFEGWDFHFDGDGNSLR